MRWRPRWPLGSRGVAGGLGHGPQLGAAGGVPFVGIHHLEGHLCSALSGDPAPELPLLVLLVSGGHTELIAMRAEGDYERLGGSRDDAAGEAFDKVARLLGLGYPGGPAIEAAARGGDPDRFAFPPGGSPCRGRVSPLRLQLQRPQNSGAARSGALASAGEELPVADLAASFQAVVCRVWWSAACAAPKTTGSMVWWWSVVCPPTRFA